MVYLMTRYFNIDTYDQRLALYYGYISFKVEELLKKSKGKLSIMYQLDYKNYHVK